MNENEKPKACGTKFESILSKEEATTVPTNDEGSSRLAEETHYLDFCAMGEGKTDIIFINSKLIPIMVHEITIFHQYY